MEQFGRDATLYGILLEMRTLLLKHDVGQEESVARVLTAIQQKDPKAIKATLDSLEFLGAAGPIRDLVLLEVPWTAEQRVDRCDQARLTAF
ncbi:MAG TPA: hypothetical protein VHR97_11305 [Candidatus Baltobacteraceae bacterium]|jgi:hypothetical protein|nr:hypothetical protein [Candidatus Baltobacteraceae bacterium]